MMDARADSIALLVDGRAEDEDDDDDDEEEEEGAENERATSLGDDGGVEVDTFPFKTEGDADDGNISFPKRDSLDVVLTVADEGERNVGSFIEGMPG